MAVGGKVDLSICKVHSYYILVVLNYKRPQPFMEYEGAAYGEGRDHSLANCLQEKMAQMSNPSYRWLKNEHEGKKPVYAHCI